MKNTWRRNYMVIELIIINYEKGERCANKVKKDFSLLDTTAMWGTGKSAPIL
jgi:hypothetical protein